MESKFNEELARLRANLAKNSTFLTKSAYEKLIKEVSNAKLGLDKKPRDYYLLKRFDIVVVDNHIKLVFPTKQGPNKYYVYDEELYNILNDAHVSVGHGGRDRMLKELHKKYKNITRKEVELFLELCQVCQQKQKVVRTGILKCNCRINCDTKRCLCRKKNFYCNPGCHQGISCHCQNSMMIMTLSTSSSSSS